MAIYALGDLRPELPAAGEYWIAPNASVIGRVRMKRNASLWFGAVARGDDDWITIGENSNVQDNSVLHTDEGSPVVIGANVTVGHKVMLHGATIGDGCLIGMSSTIMSRSTIGKNCIVGAHALIPEGRDYPDNALIVGAPARVVRLLKDEEVAYLVYAARHYVENWQRYAREMRAV